MFEFALTSSPIVRSGAQLCDASHKLSARRIQRRAKRGNNRQQLRASLACRVKSRASQLITLSCESLSRSRACVGRDRERGNVCCRSRHVFLCKCHTMYLRVFLYVVIKLPVTSAVILRGPVGGTSYGEWYERVLA
jgi:hypothetical protein